ncbi:RNA polymerase factor sigma-32 [Rhodobaculum claviforme]|uniref:RNA polymerase factor sigma-32 n=1 Tax=Rhodobaculum claviforme TaxID=1549854 RepID=A0A934TM43_9RHOB|nr:RNA polymerase factor sigma-32 [Rhodobaculum claviforme]MBK5928041.1 RNA polymerase factor sigma-32 [Rhodobaculum claviforme]
MSVTQDPTRRYIRATMASELLDADTEHALALAWRDRRDEAALHRLIQAYSRLAVSMAARFRRHGLPYEDLVQQANLGLMRAAEKFDPDNGARFSTYARWWIKASMQDYVMRNISVVRTATNAAQKKLFFNLRRVQAALERAEATGRSPAELAPEIARTLDVPLAEVELMLGRMAGPDLSLNTPQGEGEDGREWMEMIEDDGPAAEDVVLGRLEAGRRRAALTDALMALPLRERRIVVERHLAEAPRTLTELGAQLGISKERVRQLEERALARMRARVADRAPALA